MAGSVGNVWNIADDKKLHSIESKSSDPKFTATLFFAPDGKNFRVAAGPAALLDYDLTTGKKLRTWSLPKAAPQRWLQLLR